MDSLVGYLVTRFAAHPENLATEALYYILRKSRTARFAFATHLSEFLPDLPTDLVFRTQAADDDTAIPDLVGIDETGRLLVIAEAKFWAGLTDNQPLTYLKRLVPDHPGLLVFIAPEARFQTLWPELLRRCSPAHTVLHQSALEKERFCSQLSQHHALAMTSWRALVGALDARLAAAGEENSRADLHQLAGLCDRMDSDAFLPIRSDEFSPLIGRRVVQYCALIDDVVARLASEGVANSKGLRTSATAGRWGRYILLRGNGCLFYFSADAWANYRETPLWLWVKDHKWRTTRELRTALLRLEREVPCRLVIDSDDHLLVPLFLPTGTDRDAIISDVAAQIREVAMLLPEHSSEPAPEHAPEPGAGAS
jgi:hypothetical protein